MPNVFVRSGLFLLLAFVVSGCGVQVKSYAQVRERVDQGASGNAGYLSGSPATGENKNVKTTRRVYVVEFSKENQEEDLTVAAPSPRSSAPSPYIQPQQVESQKERITLPNFDSEESASDNVIEEPAGPTEAVEYTIEKDDTLQKISKKFYDSYSKWPRIYEVNKEKLPDPNRIKSGITITIPPLQ